MNTRIILKFFTILVVVLSLINTVYSVDSENITLETNDLVKFYNTSDTFNISLKGDGDVVNQSVSVTIINKNNDNKTYLLNTDNDGSIRLPINLALGRYDIISKYQFLENHNTIQIIQNSKSVLISEDFMEVYGEGLNFTGTLYDIYGDEIIGMHVYLNLTRLTNNLSKVYTSVTDYTGQYRLQINLAPGKYSVKSSFTGLNTTQFNYLASDDKLNSILVTSEKIYLTSSISEEELFKGSKDIVEYVNTKGSLPESIRLANGFVKIENFIYLLSEGIVKINENKQGNISLIEVSLANNSPIKYLKGSFNTNDLLSMAYRINQFIKTNYRLSNYDSSNPIGEVSYENYAYLFAELIKYYYTYKTLPESLNLDTSIIHLGGYSQSFGNCEITTLSWGTGGNLKGNNLIMNNIEKTSLTEKVLEESMKGTVVLSFGNGEGKTIFINAGVHGNELPPIVASFKLINTLSKINNINGKIYLICDLCPSTGSTSTRYFNGVNLNSVANIEGTVSNNLVKIAEKLNTDYFGDFHGTQPGGKPGKDTVFGTYTPTRESSLISEYISSKTGVNKIIYQKAGVEYDGAVEDVLNLDGVAAVTCEVLSPHGTIRAGSVDTSYKMMLALLEYGGISI